MPDPHLNALKHGCCARTPVLPGEDESLWREVEHDWFTDYHPQTPTSRTMVGEAAIAFWVLARNRNRLEKYERTLPLDPTAWTDPQHTTFTRFTRYKTAAERAFSNAFKNLEYLRKARLAEAPPSTAKKNKKETFEVAEQWIEARVTDGVTKTEYIPTNEELQQELEKKQIKPKLVYRRMYFPEGIPPEYAWTNRHDVATCERTQSGHWCEPCARYLHGGAGIQRMTFDTWKTLIARESLLPGQHAGPTDLGNLPRPAERGGEVPYSEMLEYLAGLQTYAPEEEGDECLDGDIEPEPPS